MKRFIRRYMKLFIGVCVILMALFVFIQTQKTTALEAGYLKHWRASTTERRIAAARVLTATETDFDLLVRCVDKMATLPESSDMSVRDAVELCFMGIQLRSIDTDGDVTELKNDK